MQSLISSLNIFLIFASVLGLFWSIFGIPIGIIITVIHIVDKKTKLNLKKVWLWCGGGVLLIAMSLVLFFIVSVIAGFLGISVSQLKLPVITENANQSITENTTHDPSINSWNTYNDTSYGYSFKYPTE